MAAMTCHVFPSKRRQKRWPPSSVDSIRRRMKLKKELRAVKEINEQERKKREDGRSDGKSVFYFKANHKNNK